jgi:hypothetical protein
LVALPNGLIAFSLPGSPYSSIEIWNTTRNSTLMTTLTSTRVWSMIYVNNQYLVTGDDLGNIQILDCNTPNYTTLASWKAVTNAQGVVQPVNALAFDPNLGVIASGGPMMLVQIWELEFLKIASTTTSTTTSTVTSTTSTKSTTKSTSKSTTIQTTKSTTISTTKSIPISTSKPTNKPTTKAITKTTTKSTGTNTNRFQKLLKTVKSQG